MCILQRWYPPPPEFQEQAMPLLPYEDAGDFSNQVHITIHMHKWRYICVIKLLASLGWPARHIRITVSSILDICWI